MDLGLDLRSVLPWDVLTEIFASSSYPMQVVLRNVCIGFSKLSYTDILSEFNKKYPEQLYLSFVKLDYLNLVKWFCPYVNKDRYWTIAIEACTSDSKDVFKWALQPQLTYIGNNMEIRMSCMRRKKTEWYIEMLPEGNRVLDVIKNSPGGISDLMSKSRPNYATYIWEIMLLAVKYNRRELFTDPRFCRRITKRIRSGFHLPALLAAHIGNVQMLDLIPGTEHIYKRIFENGYWAGQMNVIEWIEEKVREELRINTITDLRRNYIGKIYDEVDDVKLGVDRCATRIQGRVYFRMFIEKMWLVKLITEFPMDIMGVVYALMES